MKLSCASLLLSSSLLASITNAQTVFDLIEETPAANKVPAHVLDMWKGAAGVKASANLALQEIGPQNSLVFPGTGQVVSLDDLKPFKVYSNNAKCFEDDQEVSCGKRQTVFTTKDGKALVSTNGNGKIISIKARGQTTLQAVVPGEVFTSITADDVDPDFESQFILKDEEASDESLRRSLRGQVAEQLAATATNDRHLQSGNRVVELAIATESSFCATIGAANVESKVTSIIADMAFDYEQSDLGFTVQMVHRESYCDPSSDPYKPGVDTNRSGCGDVGLLDFFQDYWNANRQSIARDSAQLFSGTGLECSSAGCVIGCAYVGVTCSNPSAAYGVNYATYTSNTVAQSNLISHELGHNLGSNHDAQVTENTGFIMYPFNSGATRTFSSQSVNAFNRAANNACITVAEGPQDPTLAPSSFPTSSPTPAPVPAPTPAPVPTSPTVPAPTPAPVAPQCSDISVGGDCKKSPLNCQWNKGSCVPN